MRSNRLRLSGLATGLALAAPTAAQVSFAAPRESSRIDRYILPEQCLAAVEHTRDSLNWGQVRDTAQSRYNDTLPAPVAVMARRCVEQFPSTQAEAVQLPMWLRLALDADDDSLAAGIIARRIANEASHSVATRGAVLRDVVGELMGAQPQRLTAAQRYIDLLDALGPDAAFDAARAHNYLIAYAKAVLDLPLLSRESTRALAALDVVPSAKRNFVWPMLRGQAQAAALVPAILGDRSTAGLAFGLVGQRAPPLVGDFWFGHPDSAAAPTAGTVSLVVFDSAAGGVSTGQVRRYALLRRLKQRFPALDLVIVTRTFGYFWRREPPTPDVEARMDRDFYLDRERLAAVLSVTVTPFARLPEPDGRYVAAAVANDTAYQRSARPIAAASIGVVSVPISIRAPDFFVVDRNGTVRFEQVLDGSWEAVLDVMIGKLLEAPATTAR